MLPMYWWRLALAASALGLCPAPPRLRAARRAPRRAAARMEYTSYGETKGPISTFLDSDSLVDLPGRVVEFCLARTSELFVLCEDESGRRSIYEIPRKEDAACSAPSA